MSKNLNFAREIAQTERGNARGERNKVAAVFTHFLTQKYTPLSILRIRAVATLTQKGSRL